VNGALYRSTAAKNRNLWVAAGRDLRFPTMKTQVDIKITINVALCLAALAHLIQVLMK